jgi:hypothetical protein
LGGQQHRDNEETAVKRGVAGEDADRARRGNASLVVLDCFEFIAGSIELLHSFSTIQFLYIQSLAALRCAFFVWQFNIIALPAHKGTIITRLGG